MNAHITALYAGLCGLLVIYLAVNVTGFRKRGVRAGHADFDAMQVAIRAHGNAIEYIPIAMLLLYLAEQSGTSAIWLHTLGAAFVLSRVGHSWGFITSNGGTSKGRFLGTATSFLIIAVLAVMNIVQFFTT